jgi:hypothetical protein
MNRLSMLATLLGSVVAIGCSGQSDHASSESADERQLSYAEASKVFQAEQLRYEKAVEQNSDKVAELKERLDAARQARDAAYVRENPASSEEMDKAFGDMTRIKSRRAP